MHRVVKKKPRIALLLGLVLVLLFAVALAAPALAEDDYTVKQTDGSWILEVPAGTPVKLYWEDMEWDYYEPSSSIYLHVITKTEYASGKVTYFGAVNAEDVFYPWNFDKTDNTIERNAIRVSFDPCGGTLIQHSVLDEFIVFDSFVQRLHYTNLEQGWFVLQGYPYVIGLPGGISHLTDMLILPRAEREGYRFLGWYTEAVGGVEADMVERSDSHTLYAHWEPKSPFVIENGVLTDYIGSGGDIVIPDGVTSIGSSAFCRCESLISVIIPNGVTAIGDGAFASCSSLKSVTIPGSVTKIGNYVFTCCSSLENVTIGYGVKDLGVRIFEDCTSLKNITIPSGVTSLHQTFWGCDGLISVTIPDSVTIIGTSAFVGCSNLTDVFYTGSEKQWGEIEIRYFNDALATATVHFQDNENQKTESVSDTRAVLREAYNAYLSELRSIEKTYYMGSEAVAIIDINNDEIPELIYIADDKAWEEGKTYKFDETPRTYLYICTYSRDAIKRYIAPDCWPSRMGAGGFSFIIYELEGRPGIFYQQLYGAGGIEEETYCHIILQEGWMYAPTATMQTVYDVYHPDSNPSVSFFPGNFNQNNYTGFSDYKYHQIYCSGNISRIIIQDLMMKMTIESSGSETLYNYSENLPSVGMSYDEAINYLETIVGKPEEKLGSAFGSQSPSNATAPSDTVYATNKAESERISEEGVARIKEQQKKDPSLDSKKTFGQVLIWIVGSIAVAGVVVIAIVLLLGRRKSGTAFSPETEPDNTSKTDKPREPNSIIETEQQIKQASVASEQAPLSPTSLNPVPRFCPYCGAPRIENAEFCARCGKKL